MNKKFRLAVLLALVASLVLASAAFAQDEDTTDNLIRLEIRNRTDQVISMVLTFTGTGEEDEEAFTAFVQALSVSAGATRVFTVPRGLYDHTTFSCGETHSGTLDLTRQVRLTFVPCGREVPNQGEPTQEKVSLTEETPSGKKFAFQ